jgi:hypothetical protein
VQVSGLPCDFRARGWWVGEIWWPEEVPISRR